MAKTDSENDGILENKDLALVVAALSTSSEFTPDWHKVASKMSISHGRTAQQKFKKLIESTKKYGLVNGKVVDLEDTDGNQSGTPTAKKGRTAKATATPRSSAGRKRKAAKKVDSDDDEEESDGAEETTPAKKAKRTPRGAAKLKRESASDVDEDEEGAEEAGAAGAAKGAAEEEKGEDEGSDKDASD